MTCMFFSTDPITNEALLGTKEIIKSYYQEFPGLYPNNVRIGLFPPVQRYPAVSVNPNSSTFVSYLSGNRYYADSDERKESAEDIEELWFNCIEICDHLI